MSYRFSAFVFLCVLCDSVVDRSCAAEPVVDLQMNRDPELTLDRAVKTFPKALLELWLEALDRPDADTRCKAAATIARAKERGMTGFEPAIRPLMRELDRADQHPAVRLAAARALVALDARDAAASLLKHAESAGADFREAVEPALAKWDFKPARAVWLDRLNQPPPRHRNLLLAIEALSTVREDKAIDKLRDLVLSAEEPFSYRLAAARALGVIRPSGFETDAVKLTTDLSAHGNNSRLLAASLLRQHQGDEAVRLLQALATDREPAVALIAVGRLVEIDTRLVVPFVDKVIASPDADVRAHGVEVLLRQPSEAHVRLLGDRLSDPHPEVRDKARRASHELAGKAELRDRVIEQGLRGFNGNDWRGQEQGIYLLGHLDQKKITDRLLQLLLSPRSEVAVAAGWGLRVLAVQETLPAVLAHLRLRHQQLRAKGPRAGLPDTLPQVVDGQLSQLIQFLGQAKYKEADETLRALVPRGSLPVLTPVGGETRAAAIWALGLFHEGDPEVGLVTLIEGRLTGDFGIGPDDYRVRRMAAIALGRMKATQSLPALREVAGPDLPTVELVTHACRWSVNRMTGEPLRPQGVVEVPQQDWFLIPLR
jgi:HEAT repeat protein